MGFKVKCQLVAFMGDEERFPCHFGYQIGDKIIYDGEKFIGRVCPGLLPSIGATIGPINFAGNRYCERIMFKYAGLSKRDPSMKKHDGLGFSPLKQPPEGAEDKYTKPLSALPPTERQRGFTLVCADSRTSALFLCEPIDLANSGYFTPFYRREMAIFDKIKNDPGIEVDEILNRFNKWEREEIYPPLTPVMLDLMLDELIEVNYIEIQDGKAYPLKSTIKNPI